jgi:hypothetical protein
VLFHRAVVFATQRCRLGNQFLGPALGLCLRVDLAFRMADLTYACFVSASCNRIALRLGGAGGGELVFVGAIPI